MAPAADEDRRRRIRVRTALTAEIGEHGYRQTSLEAVLARVGVTEEEFSREFSSLEDCVSSIWEEVDAEIAAAMADAYERGEGWRESLRLALEAALGLLAAEPDRARVYLCEAVYVHPRLWRRRQSTTGRVAEMLDAGREELPPDRQPPLILGEALAAGIWHLAGERVRRGRADELSEMVPSLMYVAVVAFRGRAAAEAEFSRAQRGN